MNKKNNVCQAVAGDKVAVKEARYQATVPDTLDLAERAALAVNALTGAADPNRGYETAHCANFMRPQPSLSYRGGASCHPKVVHVLPQMRIMSGSTLRAEYDGPILDWAVNCVEADGLWWLKVDEAPWDKDLFKKDFHHPTPHIRLLVALLDRYQLDGNSRWLDIAGRMAGGLVKVVRWSGDRAWTGEYLVREGHWQLNGANYNAADGKRIEAEPDYPDIYSNGQYLRGLSLWYAVSRDPKIREVADGIARFVMKPFRGSLPDSKGWPDLVAGREHGFWGGGEQGYGGGHFHSHVMGMIGLAEYAIATGNQEAARRVCAFYEYARLHGIARMGFFPALIGPLEDVRRTFRGWCGPGAGAVCEGCGVGDMTYLAVLLSEAGLADYWDDVDQYVRNQLVEHQWVDRSVLEGIVAAHAECSFTPDPVLHWAGEGILDRLVGGFSIISEPAWNIGTYTQCCNANVPQGMYKAWRAIVRPSGDGVQVNLLLNRASAWMDIDSYLPYEGKVVLKNKTARWAAVRIPRWVDRAAVRCDVGGAGRPVVWVGNCLMVHALAPTDIVTITFPMVETVEQHTEKVADVRYTCTFKGNTLVDISPRGDRPLSTTYWQDDGTQGRVVAGYPIYRREHYKRDKAPVKTVERYVAPRVV